MVLQAGRLKLGSNNPPVLPRKLPGKIPPQPTGMKPAIAPGTGFTPIGLNPKLRPSAPNTFTAARVADVPSATTPLTVSRPASPHFSPGEDDRDGDAPELSVELRSADGDSSTVRGLAIAVSIISVFLVIAIGLCIYLTKCLRDQRTYYEAQLASARVGGNGASSTREYQPQYIEGGDDVPLVAHEEKDTEGLSKRSSASSTSLYFHHK